MATYQIKYGDTLGSIAKAQGTTVDALLKANPSIKDPNRIYAGTALTLGASEPVAAPTPQPTKPTIAEKASLIPDMQSEDPAVASYYEQQKKLMGSKVDEKKIRREIRDRYNQQFDALRLVAAQKIADERKIGEGQQGSARAIQARSGVLGSSFAQAENNQIERGVQEQADLINAEVNAKIAFLMGESEKDYSAQIAKQREAKAKGADEYIKYLNTRDSQKKEQVSRIAKLFAQEGVDPETLSADDIAKLQKNYGLDLKSFKSMVTEVKNEMNKEEFFNLTDGQSRYKYNPATGKAELVAENTKNFAPKAGSGSGTGGGAGNASGKYANDLDALIGSVSAGITALNQRNAFRSEIARARNDDDKIAALSKVLAIPADAKNDLINTNSGQRSLRTAIQLVENGTKTGFLKNGTNYAFNMFGGQVDPAMTEVKQYITAAIQPYRSSITGAAWGTQEEAEYKQLFGSTKDTPETLLTKLKNLDRIMTNKRVSIISTVADPMGNNSAFDSYYVENPRLGGGAPADEPVAGEVQVRAPDGRVIMIPEESVDQALSAGYTLTN